MHSKVKIFPLFIFTCLLCGCMHYTTGTGTAIPFSTIYIAPVKNESLAHHVQTVLSAQISQKIATYPSLKLVNSANTADVSLETTITEFDQTAATTMPDDSIRAKSFTISISIKCSLYDNRAGEYLFKDHIISAAIDSRADGDYQWNKTRSIPQLSAKLADKIYDVVCKPW